MPVIVLSFVAFAVLMVGVCVNTAPISCPDGIDHFVQYQLFMGRNNDSGEIVDDAAWDAFLKDTVIPRFPNGLTVLDGQGHWSDFQGLAYEERSKLLVVLAPIGDDLIRLTDEVSEEYKRRFKQESVLRVVYDVCASFS